jgi:hypothetical protein
MCHSRRDDVRIGLHRAFAFVFRAPAVGLQPCAKGGAEGVPLPLLNENAIRSRACAQSQLIIVRQYVRCEQIVCNRLRDGASRKLAVNDRMRDARDSIAPHSTR